MESPALAREEAPPEEHDYLAERIAWLVRLRWIAIGGVLLAVSVGQLAGLLQDAGPLFAIVAVMSVLNGFWWHRASKASPASRAGHEQTIFRQLFFDCVSLALLLHWSGGAENPFALFYALHMAIGAMLLPPSASLQVGVVASLLYGSVVMGEFVGVIVHHPVLFGVGAPDGLPFPTGLWLSPAYVLGVLLAFTLTMFGVMYFVQSVVARQREAEALHRVHERVARSRERLARIGEISAGVAHSVRNPLHGLLNCVDVLGLRVGKDPETSETLELMGEALRRIESVTQRLLALTREAPLERRTTDVNEFVGDALRLVSPRARGSAAQIDTELAEVGVADLDPNQMGEALVNVVDNALDACRAGGKVVVRTSVGAEPDWSVFIEIEDDGPGISPDDLPQIFAPFFTTKPIGEGTGLGLAIARRVVEEHGGTVKVESSPGSGTKVTFELPRPPQEASSDEVPA